MLHRVKESRYHIRPGLRAILKEAGITGVEFCSASGIPHSTYVVLCHGTPHRVAQFIHETTRQKMVSGIVATCGEEYRTRTEALWTQVPKAEIRINGDKHVQTRLRVLARKHGLTPFEYVAKLLEGPRDPLAVMALKTGGRRSK